MTDLLVDTSVVVKWFHSDGESEVEEARAILDAHARGRVDARMIDLGLHEIGNVLTRPLGWDASDIADQLDAVVEIVGPPLALDAAALHLTARLAVQHRLTFHDAAWAAAARTFDAALISSDRRLVASGLAESPAAAVRRLRLHAGA